MTLHDDLLVAKVALEVGRLQVQRERLREILMKVSRHLPQ
jgi:hypothetical protein